MIVSPVIPPSQLCPPTGFNPVHGVIERTWPGQVLFAKQRHSGAQKAGIIYQRKAVKFLREKLNDVKAGQWIGFKDQSGARSCQPDAYCMVDGRLVIFEIKLRHTDLAWWQLRKLYEPVLATEYPFVETVVVEMTKSYLGTVPFPERPIPFFTWSGFRDWLANPAGFGVFQWRGA